MTGLVTGLAAGLPLEGVRVADFTRVLTGPYCTMLLGDLGADIIKVEPPQGDDTRAWGPPYQQRGEARESSYFLSVNRNKRSVILDLKSSGDMEAAHALIGTADILVENFRPGTFEKLGLGWEALHARHPRLIYASISGFGLSGPYRDRAGYDVIAQGLGGFMSYNGEQGGQPLRAGVAVADVFAGALTTQAILAALYGREKTGVGCRVDVNLLEGVISLGTNQVSRYLTGGQVPAPQGNEHVSIVPYGTFECADGLINLAVGNDHLWRKFCEALTLTDLAANPLYDLQEVFADPHVQARKVAVTVPHASLGETTVTCPPWRLNGEAPPVRRAPPTAGQHTAEVLAELGFRQGS
ncbi:CaiB/BaiF CoA transferase family protein [Deinococcus fonticola]|uniref:CaiB/BaiF CoA transferase family protein n=1 Tax=Deinococcus fonticola TaxID=2528713 RepID=UPI001F0D0BC1|nr:CoA transferase [Deinococcus fonticola]